MNNLEIEVFDKNYTLLGNLEKRSSLIWRDKFTTCGEFELQCPYTNENENLLVEENLIWTGDKSLGVIRYVNKVEDDDGAITIKAKGFTITEYLKNRCIYPTFSFKGSTSQCMVELVKMFMINPTNQNRKVEIYISPNSYESGDKITYQNTGGDLLEQLEQLALSAKLGFTIDFDYVERKIYFRVINSVNKSFTNNPNDYIEFSSESEDIITPEYESNSTDYKNVAIVAGEGEGSNRKVIEVYNGKMIRLENMIEFGDFENGIDESIIARGSTILSQSNEYKTHGNYSLKCVNTLDNTYAGAEFYITDIVSPNNKYYLRMDGMASKLSGESEWFGEFVVTRADGTNEFHRTYGEVRFKDVGVWHSGSIYLDYLKEGDLFVKVTPIIFYKNGTAGDILHCDGILLVNLTKSFGAGKEPDKYWCDKNIKFHNGSFYIGEAPQGIDRKELFVDARDLQSKDENDNPINELDYENMLIQRGLAKLEEKKRFESFDCLINVVGKRPYVFGKDYDIGYVVTVVDKDLNIRVDSQITEVERVWDGEGYSMSLIFGDETPSISKLVKKKG